MGGDTSMTVTLEPQTARKQPKLEDYSLVGENSKWAVEQGLAEADWYQSPVPREEMVKLLERRDGPAIRDTLIWFALLGLFGTLGAMLWGSWWAIIPFALYGVIYGSTSDSRWHESSHGTAFKTDWMNNALYEVASFMVMRESTLWRWSHTRHHSDTIIVGRDPEIQVPRPPEVKIFITRLFGLHGMKSYFRKVMLHTFGRMDTEEVSFVPESDYPAIFFKARIVVLIYAGVIGFSVHMGSILPLMFVGLPNIYGAWLMPIYGLTQHCGLAENVLDHRMNCRTVHMNIINRYLYWNMNYHVEHHMFPLVPYHNLPRLHEIVKDDMPTPYSSILDAWREIIPALLRQRKDPGYYVKRKLPTPTVPASANVAAKTIESSANADAEGWVEIGSSDVLDKEEVLRFDHDERTYAVVRTGDGTCYATDGICTHGNTHLATGFVKGCLIECPKHNGRFDVRDGTPQRAPVCVGLRTFPVRESNGLLWVNVAAAGGKGAEKTETEYHFRVVLNKNVATYIRELTLELTEDSPELDYQPGQYVQMNIPAYGTISFNQLEVREPFNRVWKANHVYDYTAENHTEVRRNYSLASNPTADQQLRFNVRISTPPRGQDCNAGVGSTYMWNLKPGDTVSAIGPFGDFLIKETDREMIYLGGGSGMAPLRAHLSHLFETLKTGRKVSFWYGARSGQEIFYQDYFEGLAKQFENFTFQVALSEPLPEDNWMSHTGYIHEVLKASYLDNHQNPSSIEYYLCGPQPMIQAARAMLDEMGVPKDNIAFDEF
jgi:Na+-transporting NADH:ubiquinone oxidoreductase subunit F